MASPCAGNVGRNVVSQIALHSGLQETMYSLEKEYPPGLISVWTLIIPPRDTSYCLLRHSENIEFSQPTSPPSNLQSGKDRKSPHSQGSALSKGGHSVWLCLTKQEVLWSLGCVP